MLLQLKSTITTQDAEICVLGINHNMECTVLTVNDNSILTSYLYGTWMMKLNYSVLFHMVNAGIPSVLYIKMHSALEKKANVWPFISYGISCNIN